MGIISKDTPLAEITLRKYEKPSKLSDRDLIRKLCLSIGLLQPGDSRDVVVDVLQAVLESKIELSSEEIKEEVVKRRKSKKLPLVGIASSNIRRQLKRLKDLFLIERVGNHYRIAENASLLEIYEEKIEKFLLESIKERVREYFKAVSE